MTHFNHEWDTTKTPAVPVSVGDRYYAQDLNDDFNYLKHLPYEVFLQGRSRGVMIAPNDTRNDDTNNLTLSGGFGVILQDCIELDPDESFMIPPKTHSSPRYERISFIDTEVALPNDGIMHYIVATPTKRSLLQRTKALFTEQYASRVRYDGVITIQDTAPTAGQILVGLCHDKEYCILIDANPDQCIDNIILKKWYGKNKITQDFISTLQAYYNTPINSVKTVIHINIVKGGNGINGGTFNNCNITIDAVDGGNGINGGIFNNCNIYISNINSSGISNGTFFRCNIYISNISGAGVTGAGISGGSMFNWCTIHINTVTGNLDKGISSGHFLRCNIYISNATIGVNNSSKVVLWITCVEGNPQSNLNNTSGKLNILNGTVFHTS